jgi:phage-related protein
LSDTTVKVSFVGDADNLRKASADAGAAVEDAAAKVKRSSDDMAGGFDGVRDSADNTERRVVGFRDALTGTGDVMKGLRDGDMVTLATGFADLASSVANLGADMLEWGKKAFEAGQRVVQAHAASVAAKAKDIASTVAHRAASIASTIATQAQAAAQWALNAAMNANPVMLVVLAIAALTAAVVVAYRESETFRNIVDAIGRFLADTFMSAVDGARAVIGRLVDGVQAAVAGIRTAMSAIGGIIDGFVGFFTALPGRVVSAVGDIGRTLWNGIEAGLRGIVTAAGAIVDLWLDIYVRLPLRVLEAIGNLGLTIWNAIAGGMSELVSAVGRIIDDVVGFVRGLPGRAVDAIGNLGNLLLGHGRAMIQGLWDGVTAVWNELNGWLYSLGSRILDGVGNLGRLLYDVGRAIFTSLWDGMRSVWNDVTGWLGGIGGAIKDLKGPIEADRVLLEPEGAAIMEGLQNGMRAKWIDVESTLAAMSDELVTSMDGAHGIVEIHVESWAQTLAEIYQATATVVGNTSDQIVAHAERVTDVLGQAMSIASQFDSSTAFAIGSAADAANQAKLAREKEKYPGRVYNPITNTWDLPTEDAPGTYNPGIFDSNVLGGGSIVVNQTVNVGSVSSTGAADYTANAAAAGLSRELAVLLRGA